MGLDITALEAMPARDEEAGLPGGRTVATWVCLFNTAVCF